MGLAGEVRDPGLEADLHPTPSASLRSSPHPQLRVVTSVPSFSGQTGSNPVKLIHTVVCGGQTRQIKSRDERGKRGGEEEGKDRERKRRARKSLVSWKKGPERAWT